MTQMLTNISKSIKDIEFLQASFWFGSARSGLGEVLWFLIFSVGLVALGVVLFLSLKFIIKNNPPKQKFFLPLAWWLVVLGLTGIIFAFFRKEGVSFFSAYAFWAIHILTTSLLVLYFTFRYFRYLPGKLVLYETYMLKQKYLPKRKKKNA